MKFRKLKSNKKPTWTNLRIQVNQIAEQFHLSVEEFREVGLNEWQEVENKIKDKFSAGKSLHWLWDNLKTENYSVGVKITDIDLQKLINKDEKIWLLLNETVNEKDKYWLFEGKPSAIKIILSESIFIDEAILVSKKYDWILVHNHHDVLTGTGQMIEKLRNNSHI